MAVVSVRGNVAWKLRRASSYVQDPHTENRDRSVDGGSIHLQTRIRRMQGNMEKFGETRGGVRKSGVLEHKSGNISETR